MECFDIVLIMFIVDHGLFKPKVWLKDNVWHTHLPVELTRKHTEKKPLGLLYYKEFGH